MKITLQFCVTVQPGGINVGFGMRFRRGLAPALPFPNCDVFGKIT